MKKLLTLSALVFILFGCKKEKFKECQCVNDGGLPYSYKITQEPSYYNHSVSLCLQFDNCRLVK